MELTKMIIMLLSLSAGSVFGMEKQEAQRPVNPIPEQRKKELEKLLNTRDGRYEMLFEKQEKRKRFEKLFKTRHNRCQIFIETKNRQDLYRKDRERLDDEKKNSDNKENYDCNMMKLH